MQNCKMSDQERRTAYVVLGFVIVMAMGTKTAKAMAPVYERALSLAETVILTVF